MKWMELLKDNRWATALGVVAVGVMVTLGMGAEAAESLVTAIAAVFAAVLGAFVDTRNAKP